MELLVLSQYEIHALYLGNLARLELRVATRHDQYRIRVLSPNTMNSLPIFMIRSIGYRTRIDNTYIRLLALFGTSMSALQQCLAQRTALRKIQFAA